MRRFTAAALVLAALVLTAPLASAQGMSKVRNNQDIERELKALMAEHPELVTVDAMGQSALGQTLWTARLTSPNASGEKLVVYMDGGHHGNEYLGTELVMLFIYYLVDGWERGDANVTALLEEHDFHFAPLVNPDGNAVDSRKNARGVDLNRNYPYQWGGPGSGDFLAAPNYRGPEPLSEPETQANVAYAQSLGLDLWVTMHTGIAEFYWPWGWTHDPAPDAAMFESLEAPFENATNGRVDAMQAAELYLAAGATDDYGYGAMGVPTFTYEVHEDQFVPAYYEEGAIPEMLADQLAGLVWLVDSADKLGALVHVHDHATAGFQWTGDDLSVWLHNKGWGEARNVSLQLSEGGAEVANMTVSLSPGEKRNVTFRDVAAAGNLTLRGEYAELLINTSEVKGFAYTISARPVAEPEGSFLPGFQPALLLAGAAVALAARRAPWRRQS